MAHAGACYPAGMEIRHSVCALDCPDACSLLVNVEDAALPDCAIRTSGNAWIPVRKSGSLSRARICARSACSIRTTRLFERAKSDSSASRGIKPSDTVARSWLRFQTSSALNRFFPHSYAGTMGLLNGSGMDRRFFHRLGASRLDRTICSTTGGAAHRQLWAPGLRDRNRTFRHSKLIVAWGANILGTNVHLWPFIVEARRNGAKFYVIDPVETRTAGSSRPPSRHLSGQLTSRSRLGLNARDRRRKIARYRLRRELYPRLPMNYEVWPAPTILPGAGL